MAKKANTRNLAPYVLELQRRATTAGPSDVSKHILKCVEPLNAAYNIFYAGGYGVTATEADAVAHHLTRMWLRPPTCWVSSRPPGCKMRITSRGS